MSDLKAQAEALGIKVDGRWSDERIQQEIDKANAARQAALKQQAADAVRAGEQPRPEPDAQTQATGDHTHQLPPIEEARAAPVAPAPRKLPFRIMRDFWDEAGERHRKNTIVEMTAEEALPGVESGALSRVS